MSTALQRAEVIFISRHDVVASEGSSTFTPFSFLSLFDMLLEMVEALEHDLLRCSYAS
jgi:hypothetical protein